MRAEMSPSLCEILGPLATRYRRWAVLVAMPLDIPRRSPHPASPPHNLMQWLVGT